MLDIEQNIIGLSGHIDHGKTSLVKALTGINTDNLKEEASRGMTINIGFAFLNEQITMIDVPGHEKFIKNMVTGINAIDYALLVIAADDGIMPQTIEHFEILKLFNINDGSIIINKIDLVDDEWLELIENDVQEFVKGSFLESKKIHKVSTIENNGINELKNFLINYNFNNYRLKNTIPRIFIDRVFKAKGFGSIITGTVLSGSINVGDKLKILPQNKEVKVRGLETHNKAVQKLKTGYRGAINIHSIDKILIEKGNHLSDKSYFNLYESAIVKIKILNKVDKVIKNNERLRFYSGTQEVMARILFFHDKDLNPGESCGAILKFEKTLILSIGDKFIVRRYSPIITLGGGEVIDFSIYKKWKDNKNYIYNLFNAGNEYKRLLIIIDSKLINPFNYKTLSRYLNIEIELLKQKFKNKNEIIAIEDFWILTLNQLENIISIVKKYFKVFHESNPYRTGMIKEEISVSLKINDGFLTSILNLLLYKKEIKCIENIWSKYNFKIELSDDEERIMLKVESVIHEKNLHAITFNELVNELDREKEFVKKIINILISNGTVIMIDGSLLFSKKNIETLIDVVKDYFILNETMNIKNFKDLTETSRKFSVPLLEYLDKCNITYRIGNERKIRK